MENRRANILAQHFRHPNALWIALISATILSGVMVLGAVSRRTLEIDPHFNTLYVCLSNLVIFALLFSYNFWLLRVGIKEIVKMALCLVGSLAIATVYSTLSFKVETVMYGPEATSNPLYLTVIANLAAGIISFLISMLIHSITQHQRILLENEQLQSENLTIRYQTLQQQVSPHFLFNSLNTLDGLIGTDDPSAHRYLQQLATTFRYSMQDHTEVALSEELEFTHAYIYMMQIRHGNTLRITEHIDSRHLTRLVPPISLQLLVENAIKHNVISQRYPLEITIESTDSPSIRVSNPIHPKADSEASSGIGLVNLAQRYHLLYQKEINITNDGHTFSVELPL